jgi:hypothetical protein
MKINKQRIYNNLQATFGRSKTRVCMVGGAKPSARQNENNPQGWASAQPFLFGPAKMLGSFFSKLFEMRKFF